MAKPVAVIDYQVCNPKNCDPKGKCPAVSACKHKVIKQDAPGEPPYQLGPCLACGSCLAACAYKAIRLV